MAGDMCERFRTMPAEVGGRGDGNMGVGVAIELFLGVDPECGLAPLGVAIMFGWCRGFRPAPKVILVASHKLGRWLILIS
jgi:hypothetical protein